MINKGGKVIASGGFGCVFSPALKCEGKTTREPNKVSKLMIEKYALQEYEEINNIKKKLEGIPSYTDYFLLSDISICRPAKLTNEDLNRFSQNCSALPKNNITKKNVNDSLDKVMALNIPNGGVAVEPYLYKNDSFRQILDLHISLVNLLKKGIIPMNKKYIYHCDIKESNVLVDTTKSGLKTRLIDWGLSTEYIPFQNQQFPSTWRNRPFQFNVPFSVVIFSDFFIEKYTKYLNDGGSPKETQLKPFVLDYVNFWMKERGTGHYRYINEMMFTIFSHKLTTIPEKEKAVIIETQFTMPYIVDYIVDVLVHFTRFKSDGSLNLRDYLDNVFIKIVDIWGFITIYYPLVQALSNNYTNLSELELKIFNHLQFIIVEYLYKPRHEPINMKMLFSDLKNLGNLLNIHLTGKKMETSITIKSTSSKTIKSTSSKTKKNKSKTRFSFKRTPKKRRVKKSVFLSL